jgi:hypothetical protein
MRGAPPAETDEIAHYEALLVAMTLEVEDAAAAAASVPPPPPSAVYAPSLAGAERGDTTYAELERRIEGVALLYEFVERLVRRADPLIAAYERSVQDVDQRLGRARVALASRASADVSSHSHVASLLCPAALGCSLACELRLLVALALGFLVAAALLTS